MFKKFFSRFFNKILWELSPLFSKILFLSHRRFYKNPIIKNKITNDIKIYEDNFINSVSLENFQTINNKTYLDFPPDIEFIKQIAFDLQNVLKNKKNSYFHGFILNSYLKRYLSNNENSVKPLNIIDIGTAKGFSTLCFAKVLDTLKIEGKIFTFDVIPNRSDFYWNTPSDVLRGKISRNNLLNPWRELIDKYVVFFSTATFHSLEIVDIPLIHFAFIDGSHEFHDVIYEIKYIIRRLNKNAILIFDDYDQELFPGVVKACDYLKSLDLHSSYEFIKIQNNRQLAIFTFGNV